MFSVSSSVLRKRRKSGQRLGSHRDRAGSDEHDEPDSHQARRPGYGCSRRASTSRAPTPSTSPRTPGKRRRQDQPDGAGRERDLEHGPRARRAASPSSSVAPDSAAKSWWPRKERCRPGSLVSSRSRPASCSSPTVVASALQATSTTATTRRSSRVRTRSRRRREERVLGELRGGDQVLGERVVVEDERPVERAGDDPHGEAAVAAPDPASGPQHLEAARAPVGDRRNDDRGDGEVGETDVDAGRAERNRQRRLVLRVEEEEREGRRRDRRSPGPERRPESRCERAGGHRSATILSLRHGLAAHWSALGDGRGDLPLGAARLPRDGRRGASSRRRRLRPPRDRARRRRAPADAPRPHRRGGADEVRVPLRHRRGMGKAAAPLPSRARGEARGSGPRGDRAARARAVRRRALLRGRPRGAAGDRCAAAARAGPGGARRDRPDPARPLRRPRPLPRAVHGPPARRHRGRRLVRRHGGDRRDRGRAGHRHRLRLGRRARRLPPLPAGAGGAARGRDAGASRVRPPARASPPASSRSERRSPRSSSGSSRRRSRSACSARPSSRSRGSAPCPRPCG